VLQMQHIGIRPLWLKLNQFRKIIWTLVNLSRGEKSIGCKWIFKKKYHTGGSIEKYKARLIAKDFTQNPNIDYFDNFVPMTRIFSIS